MRRTLLSCSMIVGLAAAAHAAPILTFGQTATTNTTVATANAGGTATTIVNTDTTVDVTQIDGAVTTPFTASYDFTATSVGAASTTPIINQRYSGSFCITSGLGCSGTNYLTGTFSDIALAQNTSAILAASTPDTITFTSDVITTLDLPRAVALSFSNVTPGVLALDGTTIPSFTAAVSGTFSATPTPEPASILALGVGLLGLGLVRRRA